MLHGACSLRASLVSVFIWLIEGLLQIPFLAYEDLTTDKRGGIWNWKGILTRQGLGTCSIQVLGTHPRMGTHSPIKRVVIQHSIALA